VSAGAKRIASRPSAAPPSSDAAAAAIDLLKDEHLAIASVLFSLRAATHRIRAGGPPDFRLLRALVDYVVAFPERLHHPKEERYLFAALVARCREAKPLVAALEAEHAEGAARIAALVDALVGYAAGDGAAFPPFADAVEAYVEFHWRHMAKEEDVLLPLARRHLAAEDWARIAAAFRENDNPLSGLRPREDAGDLFRRILDLMPAPAEAPPHA
jgi:hemerythrin-like domain-containing protein